MNRNSRTKGFWQGKGFYLALALVVAGAALASYLAINNMMTRLGQTPNTTSGGEDLWGLEDTQVEQKVEDVPKPSVSSQQQNTASSQAAQSPAPSTSGAVSQQPKEPQELQPAQTQSYTLPITGETLAAFSGDDLVFNETMQDWRTHNGVDFKGEKNMGVYAPTTAQVTKVFEDAQWGGVIEMEAGGVTIRLCGLKEMRPKVGDTIQQGDTIALLGNIPAESALDLHLHMEALKDGKYIDPASFFAVQE